MNTFLYGPRQLLKPTQRGGGRRRFHMNASLLSGFHFAALSKWTNIQLNPVNAASDSPGFSRSPMRNAEWNLFQ